VRALLLLLAACAPEISGPIDHQRALDREDSARLAAQLAELPGAVRADVALHRPFTDPLTRATTPASAAIVVVVDDGADRAAIAETTRKLARAAAPEIADPQLAVALGATRPTLARVGPFTVDAHSAPALKAALAAALALIAALAGWIAFRERHRNH
jgi:type III secretory pathway lipoprotein EscJ